MRVTVSRPLQHRCPYRDEVDAGSVEASWNGDAVELHALAHQLEGYRTQSITHEQVTAEIAQYIAHFNVEFVEVTTRWQTAGLVVEVAEVIA